MDRKKLLMSGLALGAAYLLKDKGSRQKLMNRVSGKSGKHKA
ncbi:hypothetical protein [Peribacillus sp. SCS-155]